MTNKTIENQREVGGDCFTLIKSIRSRYKLDHFITFDKDDYYIYKTTKRQREVTYEEMLEFNYSGYTFFKKGLYNKDEINKWLDFLYSFIYIHYINKPLPPIYMIDRIKIKK